MSDQRDHKSNPDLDSGVISPRGAGENIARVTVVKPEANRDVGRGVDADLERDLEINRDVNTNPDVVDPDVDRDADRNETGAEGG